LKEHGEANGKDLETKASFGTLGHRADGTARQDERVAGGEALERGVDGDADSGVWPAAEEVGTDGIEVLWGRAIAEGIDLTREGAKIGEAFVLADVGVDLIEPFTGGLPVELSTHDAGTPEGRAPPPGFHKPEVAGRLANRLEDRIAAYSRSGAREKGHHTRAENERGHGRGLAGGEVVWADRDEQRIRQKNS